MLFRSLVPWFVCMQIFYCDSRFLIWLPFAVVIAQAKQVVSAAENAPQLRDENLRLHKENMKIQEELAES